MLMIIGTGTGHFVLADDERFISGVAGVVKDGIIPGYYGYEAGQSCTGDMFDWFIKNCVPAEYENEAAARQINIHELLREKALLLSPGESGLIALDWWNGCRSVLFDGDLSGLIIGCALTTKPEDIYRVLIEATAYGTRLIVEVFEKAGVEIKQIFAAGGIAEKDAFLMQIYSDVLNKDIVVPDIKQACALGSAIFAAAAAGEERGGYRCIQDAIRAMSKSRGKVYTPNKKNYDTYSILFEHYLSLHDYFGRGLNDIMKDLKKLKRQ